MNNRAEQLQSVPVVVVVALGNPDLPDNMALHYYLSQAGTEVVAEARFEDDKHYIPQSSTDHTEAEHLVEHQSARFLLQNMYCNYRRLRAQQTNYNWSACFCGRTHFKSAQSLLKYSN